MSKPNYLRPFFTFYGGKWTLAPNYGRPRHKIVIEPFAGSAGYSLNYYERDIILIEKDPVIFSVWKFLQSATAEDIHALPEIDNDTNIANLNISYGAKNLIGFWCGRGLEAPRLKLMGWAKHGKYEKQYWGSHVKERIARQVEYIKHWKIILASAFDAVTKIDRPATWFIDPPYQMSGGHRYVYGSYGFDFVRLASLISGMRGQIIVCEGSHANWMPFEYLAHCKTQSGGSNTEMIYRRDQ